MLAKRRKIGVAILLIILTKLSFSQTLDHWVCYPGYICPVNKDTLFGCVLFYESGGDGTYKPNDFIYYCSKIEYVDSLIDTTVWGKNNRRVYSSVVSNDPLIKRYNNNIINCVRIYGDENKINYLDYKNLYKDNILWKLIKKKDSVAIYYELILPITYYTVAYNIILETPNEKIKMNSFGDWFKNSSIEKSVVHFINERYRKSFKTKDFKSIDDMFDYILTNQ